MSDQEDEVDQGQLVYATKTQREKTKKQQMRGFGGAAADIQPSRRL